MINPEGLTMGGDFDADMQGGSLLFDGINLTAQCTVGNVNITSTLGSIYGDALENIGMTAAVGIGLTAGVGIIADAVTDINLISGGMTTVDAEILQVTTSGLVDMQSGGLMSMVAATAISLDSSAVSVNGGIITLN